MKGTTVDLWSWLTAIPAGAVVSGVGVSAFIVAILTDRLLTRGQHLRRVADLVEHHAREQAASKERLELVDESRKEWKSAANAERERADKAVDTMATVADSIDGIHHILSALNESLKEAKNG